MARDLPARLQRLADLVGQKVAASSRSILEVAPAGSDGLTHTADLAAGVHYLGPTRSPVYLYDPAVGPDEGVIADLQRRHGLTLVIILDTDPVAPPRDFPRE